MKAAIWGVWHVHAPEYTRTAQKFGEVVGFYEPDDALAAAFAAQFALPRFATAQELLASDAEGVIVCSATNTHADDMVAIANAGKHIFTEKVLALTDADCARVQEAVKTHGVQFVISLFQKYLPSAARSNPYARAVSLATSTICASATAIRAAATTGCLRTFTTA